MGVTLARAQQQLEAWLDADLAVSKRQSYSIGGRSLTAADAGEITAKIEYWTNQVNRLQSSAGRGRTRYVEPR
jgi:hypothetical protein